ncbi:MAG: FHA domain-containing protein [Phycisphaerae bacterium]|nr:FHA domain-containing protein [Phycisphaerae bacterium]
MNADTPAKFHLEIHSATGQMARLPLDRERVILGRGQDAHLRLPSQGMSRHHTELKTDDAGHWSVRDLGSRNGTFVNDERLEPAGETTDWTRLEAGDRVGVDTFSVLLMRDRTGGVWGGEEKSRAVSVDEDDDGQELRTLADAEPMRIEPAQLLAIGNLGLHLVQLVRPERRLKSLCRRVLRDEMHGEAVVALRLSKDDPHAPPQSLCQPLYAPTWPRDREIYISRTVLRSVLETAQPVLAGGAGDVEVSLAGEMAGTTAVIACPLANEPTHLDMLYVVVPPHYATLEWLALYALTATQYQIAERAHRES